MANLTEFNQYSTNTRSLLFDGYMTFNPGLAPVISPEFFIALGAGGDVTLGTDGILRLRDGADGAAGTKYLELNLNNIVKKTVKGVGPQVAAAKVVDLQSIDIDYNYANAGGITGFYVDGIQGRDTVLYKKDYISQFPASANVTAAQRVADVIKRVNLDPTAKFTAAPIAGTMGAGSGVAGAGIRLTSKTPGEDYTVTAGDGFAPATVVTPAASEFGTSLYVQNLGVPVYAGALTGKTFKTAMFSYLTLIADASSGHFKGNSVGNNAEVFQRVAVFVCFEVGAGDTLLTNFDKILQGKDTPATKYNAVTSGLGL